MQNIALKITLLLLIALTAAFVWVLLRTKPAASLGGITTSAYRLRSRLFWIVMFAGVAIAILTLSPWPHDTRAAGPVRAVEVKARQWAWELSDNEVRVGEVIEFRVTSEDVNHGFALYDENKQLVAQIQAMPGFTNKVRYRFDRPGKYEVLCLEYCGVAHHGMVAEITAKADAPQ